MELLIRHHEEKDKKGLRDLYVQIATVSKGIARNSSEISEEYIDSIYETIHHNGLGFVGILNGQIIAEIHASSKGIQIFDHLLAYLTIGIHPDFQNMGIGKSLFQHFLDHISLHRRDIYRVELESRASNTAGIKLYERMGFVKEGYMKNQTKNLDGSHEDGVMYAWFNPSYILKDE